MKGLDEFFDGVASASFRSIPRSPDDTIDENGLLVCGKCGGHKERIFKTRKKEIKVRVACECIKKMWEEQEREENERLRKEHIDRMRTTALHDSSLSGCRFETSDIQTKSLNLAQRYFNKWDSMLSENVSVIFTGGVGCGKTYAAACIANALLDRGVPVLMSTTSKLIDKGTGYDQECDVISTVGQYDLLILDDFGAERATEYSMQKLFEIVDERIKSKKPMIITTNLTEDQLRNPQDLTRHRIYSRVLGACFIAKCTGGDLRQVIKKKREEGVKKLLGKE